MRVGLKFGLEEGSQRWSYRSNRTHIKGTEDPVEVQPPGSDSLTVILLVKTSRDRILFTPFDDVLLDLDHSTAIENFVSKSSE